MNQSIKKVVIAGGGTAGWMAAATLAAKLNNVLEIILVESDDIGTVGVGEATIPPLKSFHKLLRIDEREFMQATSATFKLGIEFDNWGEQGDSYIHSFGRTGSESWLADFVHFWRYAKDQGFAADFGDYCFELQAARAGKFALTDKGEINYAYHMDAGRYAKFLRHYSEKLGVKRIEGRISEVKQHGNGDIQSLLLASGETVEGDFFIDCSGFRGLLIEQTLHTGYEDWSHWLPCDAAVAVQTESTGPAVPYTRSVAHDAGWRWRIPLQHRVGNGLVYCSKYLSDEQAIERLLSEIDGEPLTEPKVIKFRTGKRRQQWNKNCVALGLASGFVEPLESTSIHLIMVGMTRLIKMFPFNGVTQTTINEYNRQSAEELEHIRDFIILHYHATERSDSPFWRHCKDMPIPESLAHRMAMFRENGHIFLGENELFRSDSWTQVMLGQRMMPQSYHQGVTMMPPEELKSFLDNIQQRIAQVVSRMPSHQEFLQRYCPQGD